LREAGSKHGVTTGFHTIGWIIETDNLGRKVLGALLINTFPDTIACITVVEDFALGIHDAGTDEDAASTHAALTLLVGGAGITVITGEALFQFIDADTGRARIHRTWITVVTLIHLSGTYTIVAIVIEGAEVTVSARCVSRCINRRAFPCRWFAYV